MTVIAEMPLPAIEFPCLFTAKNDGFAEFSFGCIDAKFMVRRSSTTSGSTSSIIGMKNFSVETVLVSGFLAMIRTPTSELRARRSVTFS